MKTFVATNGIEVRHAEDEGIHVDNLYIGPLLLDALFQWVDSLEEDIP